MNFQCAKKKRLNEYFVKQSLSLIKLKNKKTFTLYLFCFIKQICMSQIEKNKFERKK